MARPAHHTHISRTVLRLRELIFNGEISPGERMSELPLVDRLGVSRTPLRLALAELEHEGLLRSLPGGGYVVREFTQGDVRDAIELRGVLEGTAARFAAERGATQRDLTALKALNETIRKLVARADYESFERYLHVNESFHARLIKMAGSPMLQRAMEGITSLPFARASAFVLADWELDFSRDLLIVGHRHHVNLIEAIERRQGARAEALAREHARVALTHLEIAVDLHREQLDRLPGASLIALPTPEPAPAPAPASASTSARESEPAREPEPETT